MNAHQEQIYNTRLPKPKDADLPKSSSTRRKFMGEAFAAIAAAAGLSSCTSNIDTYQQNYQAASRTTMDPLLRRAIAAENYAVYNGVELLSVSQADLKSPEKMNAIIQYYYESANLNRMALSIRHSRRSGYHPNTSNFLYQWRRYDRTLRREQRYVRNYYRTMERNLNAIKRLAGL